MNDISLVLMVSDISYKIDYVLVDIKLIYKLAIRILILSITRLIRIRSRFD